MEKKVHFTDAQIDFMRADIESGFKYTELILKARETVEAQGRDFDKEFQHYKETGQMIIIKKEDK